MRDDDRCFFRYIQDKSADVIGRTHEFDYLRILVGQYRYLPPIPN